MNEGSTPVDGLPGIAAEPRSILTRGDLDSWTQTPLKIARSWFTPDVILLQQNATRLVLKDVRHRPLLFRLLWCRSSIAREVNAMRRLEGMAAAPRIISELDSDGFVMEWLDGRPLPARRFAADLGTLFFQELEQVVREMHNRGVAHGDLRRRNILITPEKTPRIIDFETAVLDGPGLFRRNAFAFASRVDDLTALKIFGKYFPNALKESDRQLLSEAPLMLKFGRFLRKRVYRHISPKLLLPRLRRWRRRFFGR